MSPKVLSSTAPRFIYDSRCNACTKFAHEDLNHHEKFDRAIKVGEVAIGVAGALSGVLGNVRSLAGELNEGAQPPGVAEEEVTDRRVEEDVLKMHDRSNCESITDIHPVAIMASSARGDHLSTAIHLDSYQNRADHLSG